MTTSTSFTQMANKQSISLSSALCANTPPTKGQTTSHKFLTLSIFFLLSFFCTTNAWGAEYSYTFTSKQFSANGSITLGDVSWTLAGDGSYLGYDGTKGQQFGSGSAPYKTLTLSTSGISGTITKIIINTSGAKDVNASFTVSVGGTQWGNSTKLTTTATAYTFTGSKSGEIKFLYTQTSSKALYIKSISVTYETAASHTVTWKVNGETYTEGSPSTSVSGGGKVTKLPTNPTLDCSGKVFAGWTTDPIDGTTSTKPSVLFTTAENSPAITEPTTFYAVFATATGGGSTTDTYDWESTSTGNWTVDDITRTASQGVNSSYAGKINTNHTYVTYSKKVAVTNFSFQFKRTSTNSNYNVYIETSTDKSNWSAAATYAMNSFGNGSYTSKSQTFDGDTELYVRFHCYNTTAVRYVDNVSISYSGGTTYSDYTTTCDAQTSYSVTWNPNGGNWSGNTNYQVDSYEEGESISKPADPTRDGYTFNSWDPEPANKMGTENLTYTAQWTAIQTTITLDINGGSGNTTSVDATYDSSTLNPSSIINPTKTGHTFGGWYSGEGGTGSLVINSSGKLQANVSGFTGTNGVWKATTDKTLYAKWTAKTYTVTLDNQGATTAGAASVTATYNAAMPSIASNLPQKTGYTFNGYFDAASGGTQYYKADGTSAKNWDKTAATTLYAQWTELLKYTVTLVPGSGSVTSTTITESSAGKGVELPTPTLDCGEWKFAGWKTTSAVTTETTTEPTLIPAGNYKPTANITLYAVYSKTETIQGGGTTSTEASLSFASTAQRTSFSSTQQVWEQNDITLTNTKGTDKNDAAVADYANPARFYANSKVIIEAPGNITQIVFDCNSDSYATAMKNSITGETSLSNDKVTLELDGTSDSYTITSISAQVRIDALTVTYTTSGGGSTTTTTYNSNPECGPQKLATPNVELTYDCSSATITWDAVTNAKAYWYQIIKTGDTNSGISSTNTTYTRNDIEPGVSYTWSVKTIGDGSKFSDSEIATGTFTAYSIQWLANGELIENACGKAGEAIVVPSNNPASCDDAKEFVGWTDEPIGGVSKTAPEHLYKELADFPTINANTTYYAVFANAIGGGGNGYTKLGWGSLISSGQYLISTGTYTITGKSGNKVSELAVIEYSPTTEDKIEYEVTIDVLGEYFTIKLPDNQYWVGWASSTSTDLTAETPETNKYYWKYTENGIQNQSETKRYLQVNGACDAAKVYTTDAPGTNWHPTYLYAKNSGASYTNYVTTCCKQPKTPLTITADQTELVKSGVVTLTATGGNGTNITWTTTGGELSNQSNTGATLTISDVDATQNITVTATQAENNNDDEVVYCAQEASIDITVKAQWTITFWTNDNGNKESNSMTVTDGDSYTMPDISDEYICTTGHSFVGWVDNENDTELDATPNSTQTATANQTWYAAWSSSASTKIVDVYQLVTNVTNLAAGDKVWITNATPTVAMGGQNNNNRGQVTVTNHPTVSDKIYSTGSPATLTIGKDGTNYTFHDGTGYLYAASSSSNYLKTKATLDANGKWSINITNEGVASIVSQGTYTRNTIRYNKSNTPPLFSCYASGQSDVKIYKNVGRAEIEVSGASITTNNTSCHRGAVISAENGKWITSSKGQKVRIAINVTARGFNSDATLSATSANEHFSVVSITNTTITQNSAFETQMMIEYQPAEANTNENAEITLVAKKGEEVVAIRTIDVNGRSLPDEFVIVAQYSDKWLALPANMQSGADQYNGIEVTPNNALTQIPAAPSTTIYSLRGVADNRYETAGTCVRLVGNGNKCLWANAAATNTTIQNWTTLASTNGSNYEWLLTTSDGEQYTIANPAHPDYNQGRILSNSGSKYGLYKGTTKFYILPVGCSSQPGNIQVTARRVDATFSWEGSASSMKIDVYTNDMTEGNISNTATASPYYMTGLSESTQYWFKMTPNGTDDDCAYTGSFKTTGPTIDVVEWQENAAVIFVDKDDELNPLVIIDGEVEHGVGGTKATDIFFSKYFEAQSEAKLLAIYNGTANAISLADITILQRGTKHSSTYVPLSLAPYGKTPGWIQPGEELILYNEDQSAYSEDIMKCAESDPTFSNWVKVDNNNLAFSGKGTVRLFRGNKCIDIIGAMGSAEDIHDKEVTPLEGTEKPSFGDKEGFTTSTGDNYQTPDEEKDYTLSTNRCLLVRKPSVTSGAIAVEKNIGDFKTLGNDYDGIANEWAGLQVPNGPSDDKYKYTCEGFQEVGSFDYNNYYKEYNNIDDDTYLKSYTHDNATKEYIIPIENLAKYSCLNLRFQLKKDGQVLTEEPVQVPIIVSGEKATNDAIFNAIVKTDASEPVYDQSIERCKTCNVVVLSDATLTKAANNATNDVAEVANLKVYPGGQVIVPAETNYTVNSLAFRRQEDEVSMANIQGTLNVKHANGVYLDVRIDPSNWHYMTLPYDCRVGDVTFADGTPAVVNTDYLLGWYDGAYRAEHKTGGWTYITDNDYILKKGLGYIVALPGDGKVRREIRFPMANSVIAEDKEDKTVGGLYAYGGDKTDAELRPNHKGWNMIGSPYLYTYTTDIVNKPLQMGTLEHSPVNPWDGTWVRTGDARYIVEPIDNGWSGYRQTTISNLKPFTSYFIQVGGELENGEYTTITPETEQQIEFAANSVARNASAPRKVAEAEVTDNHPVWYGVEMIAPNNEKDNTTLLISDEFTDGYDMMDDLVKMRGDYYQYYNFPVLASRNNEGEMAFNALPDSSAAKIGVPLSYYAATAGTYTIATDGRFDLEEVKAAMLYDATTAQYTNLLTENYSFTTNKGNNTNRFTLFVTVERKKVPNITTGMDNLLANGQLSLIAVERTLVLSGLTENADIYVYDMSGKMVTGTHSAGENGIWRTTVPATGVYFVRINSANSQQTLRTIVK